MKALIGTKLLNLKDCVGYTKILIFHETPSYFLIYERFDKISLVVVYMYGDISDFNFYNIKYLDILYSFLLSVSKRYGAIVPITLLI